MSTKHRRSKIPQEKQRYRSKSQREAAVSLEYFQRMNSIASDNPSTNDLTDSDSKSRRVSDGRGRI